MPGKGVKTRADLRGKPLDKICNRAQTLTQRYRNGEIRMYCLGLATDQTCDHYLDECRHCRALMFNN